MPLQKNIIIKYYSLLPKCKLFWLIFFTCSLITLNKSDSSVLTHLLSLSCYNWLLSNYNSSQNHVNVLPGTLPKKTYYNLCTLILYMLATLKGMLFLLLSLFTVGCPKVIQQWMPNCHVNAPRRRLRETDLNIILHSI